jgi:hypothetical protein
MARARPAIDGDRWTVQIVADRPALDLKAGDTLHVVAQTWIDCDCRYQARDGEIYIVQTMMDGTYRVTCRAGLSRAITAEQLHGRIVGRVARVQKGARA